MATKETCPFYADCGFVLWKMESPDPNATIPLGENGDCGKKAEDCPRAKSDIPIAVGKYGPQTEEEMNLSYPWISNTHGRPAKRIAGGGNR